MSGRTGKFNAITRETAQRGGLRLAPTLHAWEQVKPGANLRLRVLLGRGYYAAGFGGETRRVKFNLRGVPFKIVESNACPHGWSNDCMCGYWAVRVKSEFGAVSVLYYEPEGDRVSGTLGLREGK